MASAIEVAEKADRIARAVPSATVKIVGRWVWVDFAVKPIADVRSMLKAEDFRWNHKRGCWQFAGVPTRGSRLSRPDLEDKYGVEELQATL